MTTQKLSVFLVFLFFTSFAFSQSISRDSIKKLCNDCPKDILGAPSGLFMALKDASISEERLIKSKKCLACQDLPNSYKYGLANRIANMHMYRNDSRDSVIKYMELADSYSPTLFCQENYMVDFWIQEDNPTFFKDFHPMYIRMLSEEIWTEKLNKCKKCCPEALAKAKEKQIKETPTNQAYYDALVQIFEDDQKYRKNYDETLFKTVQVDIDAENRRKLDELYEKYGMPLKEEVTSEGIGAAWYVIMHSTDCEWTKKWIIKSLDAQVENKNSIANIAIVINRFFYAGEDSDYGHEETVCNEAEGFLKMLREKYSDEIAKQYEFYD